MGVQEDVFSALWEAVKSCPELEYIRDANGFVRTGVSGEGADIVPMDRPWAVMWPAPGGHFRPFADTPAGEQSYCLRLVSDGWNAVDYYRIKAAVVAAWTALGQTLGVAGVSTWYVIDSTEDALQVRATAAPKGWIILLKVVVSFG